jgi:hypothetical protein
MGSPLEREGAPAFTWRRSEMLDVSWDFEREELPGLSVASPERRQHRTVFHGRSQPPSVPHLDRRHQSGSSSSSGSRSGNAARKPCFVSVRTAAKAKRNSVPFHSGYP